MKIVLFSILLLLTNRFYKSYLFFLSCKQWTGLEDLSECVDPKNEIDISNISCAGGLFRGIACLTAGFLREFDRIYDSFCSSLPNRSKKDGTFRSGFPYRLPSKLSNKLKSGTCIDQQSTKDVVVGNRLRLVGRYIRAPQFDRFKTVEIELYWEYTNCVSICHTML